MNRKKPSELELQVLAVLWQRGPSAVREVLDAMPDGKPRAYTTLLSVLQVMEKKGLVTHDRRGMSHIYRPLVKQAQVLGALLRNLTRNVFGGNPAAVMQFLLSDADVSSDQAAEIRSLVDQLAATSEPRPTKGDDQ